VLKPQLKESKTENTYGSRNNNESNGVEEIDEIIKS
jgi:hypothetical protein